MQDLLAVRSDVRNRGRRGVEIGPSMLWCRFSCEAAEKERLDECCTPLCAELPKEIVVINEAPMLEEPLTQPTRFSMDPFFHGLAGQHTSIPTLRSSATPPKGGFHSVTFPSRVHFSAIVFGRSKTASSG